ncbi:unnamed protein product [Ceutorhynchus assimilis]|uniref:WW domain binding protein 1-like n=1 Tax=Ceutorhynchus assimilis TaxID=467358 RepID=A0A9N9MS66_9CUCU|nr:unnamed protein product [Ceutorhynchus assimilis]
MQMENVKLCTLHGNHRRNYNVTSVLKYVCYNYQTCCDRGNGCCPALMFKYYESWTFWIFVFGIILLCYLLCWYCKKLEKERQSAQDRQDNQRNVDTNSVDNLLQTLISMYRNRLVVPNPNESVQNVDENKASADPPPKYVDALTMPKPLENSDAVNISSDGVTSDTTVPSVDIQSFTVIEIDGEDESVPSYEEAVKEIP